MHSRHHAAHVDFRHSMMRIRVPLVTPLLLAAFAIVVVGAPRLEAQRPVPDSTRAVPAQASIPADSLVPPISPRRAFFMSFLLPGYSQAKLGRYKAGATFVFVEAMSIAMIRESAADVHEARRSVDDTVVVSYVDPS